MSAQRKPSFAETGAARGIAVVVFLGCAGVLGYLHRDDLFPPEVQEDTAGANPEFIKCRDERAGQVDKMLEQGIIDEAKHGQFRKRAIDFCTAQFPPGG